MRRIVRAAWPHIAKLLSFSGLVALLFVRPHPPARVLPASAYASEADVLETLGSGEVAEVAWSVLAGLNIRTGERTELLGRLDGEVVRVAGFVVPLDDLATGAAEFLLVPYYGACIHTPPPPPNQMVHVTMDGGQLTAASPWEPVWVEGMLEVIAADTPYGVVSHRMRGRALHAYTD